MVLKTKLVLLAQFFILLTLENACSRDGGKGKAVLSPSVDPAYFHDFPESSQTYPSLFLSHFHRMIPGDLPIHAVSPVSLLPEFFSAQDFARPPRPSKRWLPLPTLALLSLLPPWLPTPPTSTTICSRFSASIGLGSGLILFCLRYILLCSSGRPRTLYSLPASASQC